MKYPAYPDYEYSGVPWIGQKPKHWQVMNLNHMARLKSGSTITSADLDENGIYPVYGGNGVRGAYSQYTHEGEYALIGRQGAECGNVNYAKGKFWASEHAVVVHPDRPLHYRWLGETLRAMNLNQYSQSAAQPGLSVEVIGRLKLPFPPLDEQEQIADFLDWRTAQIDALIAKKQTLIDRLREQRQSLIAHHVTRGLSPQTPTQETAIPWLQHIPAHWDTIPLGFLTTMSGGMTPSMNNPEYWDGDVPWVTPKDMKQAEVSDATDHVTDLALSETGLSLVPPGAILIVVRGMILAHSFPTAIVRTPVTINQDMKALRCTEQLDGEYLFWCLNGFADVLINLAQESAHGTKKMETETIKKFVLPVPPLDEQQNIAKQLSKALQKIDQSNRLATEAIDRLTEYRSALITAAVTGQIDVRGVPVPAAA